VFQADVLVVGGGLIGLACAPAVARAGLRVRVISAREPGAASAASAGILAPSVGRSSAAARSLAIRARDLYPDYLRSLAERTGVEVPLDRAGVLEVAFDEARADALLASLDARAQWIDGRELRRLEPSLAWAPGAAFHPDDGAVDVRALLEAVRADAERESRASLADGRVVRIRPGRSSISVELENAERADAAWVIIAAGAWSGGLAGLPRPLPVTPARGQMLAFESARLAHVVMGPHGYLVPRGARTLAGSTMEDVGFDGGPTAEGAAILRDAAVGLSPALAHLEPLAHWAGLRPMTPDLLPIVGSDPDFNGLVYACGHSKNGVLLAPLTAQAVAGLVGAEPRVDVGPYTPARFDPSR
jgi:glycine oxidase